MSKNIDYMGRLLDSNGSYIDENGDLMTGCCAYEGITVQQHPNIFQTMENFLNQSRPTRVLEIGTAAGGFTLFLRHCLNKLGLESTKIKTFEIHPASTHEVFNQFPNNIELLYENLFNQSYTNLSRPELIQDYIQPPGTTLVICDGGNKVTEFNTISPLLKLGDYIMAHDYSLSIEYFNQYIVNKIWCWVEITEADIHNTCIENGLEPYMAKELQNVVWVCKRKNK
jgi:cephalosporin hydroxylase